jgi:hypothetical protein
MSEFSGETTEEFAPDLYSIISDITSMINEKNEYENIITYIIEQKWKDIIILNRPIENKTAVSNEIIDSFSQLLIEYEGKRTNIIQKAFRKTRENSALSSLKMEYIENIFPTLKKNLNKYEITIDKVIDEKITQIKILKDKIIKYLIKNPDAGSLYTLEIIEEANNLTVNVRYTNLGYLIMLKTEINHDLQKFLLNDQFNVINSQLNKIIVSDSELATMLVDDNDDDVIYNENTAIDLVVAILEHKKIKIISEKNNYTWIDTTKPEGASTLPKIWKGQDINVTSDADNAGAFKVLTAGENKLKQYNNINKQLLNLDAGSSPKLGEGIQNEYIAREKQLNELKKADSTSEEQSETVIKSVTYNIYNPKEEKIIEIKNTDIYGNEEYDITIFYNPNNTKVKKSNAINRESIIFKVKNLSIPTVIEKINEINDINEINKIDNGEAICNTAILKSLGDLIVYQVLCYITAIRHPESISITSSIDYSAIFTTVKNIIYIKNGENVTEQLNNCNIYAGCNFYGSNGFVPLTTRSRKILDIIHTIVQENSYLHQKIELQFTLGEIFYRNQLTFKNFINLYNSLNENGLSEILIDKTQCIDIRDGLTQLNEMLKSKVLEYIMPNEEDEANEEHEPNHQRIDDYDNTFATLLYEKSIGNRGGSKKHKKSKNSKQKRTRKNRKNPISK